jgi:hypothetical protein
MGTRSLEGWGNRFGAKERVKEGFLPGISLDLFRLRKEMVEIGERADEEREGSRSGNK